MIFQAKSLPVDFLLKDRDVLAALADVERAKKREAELRNKTRIKWVLPARLWKLLAGV